MSDDPQIKTFLNGSPFAVVGASTDRSKYGNMVLRTYLQNDLAVTPVNPKAAEIEGVTAARSISEIEHSLHGISVITPPAITEKVVEEAIQCNVKHIWMQPGAESAAAVTAAQAAGINVIHGGPCLLVVLGFQGHGP